MVDGAAPSIHRQRLGYYLLWCGLLVASLVALALWLIPARKGQGTVVLSLTLYGVPKGSQAEVWSGPTGAWSAQAPWPSQRTPFSGERLQLQPMAVPLAERRWQGGYIPSRTWDLILLRITSPEGERRYFLHDLRPDLETGSLGIRRRLTLSIEAKWANLSRVAVVP